MKVGKLIEELQNYDEDMEVRLLSQAERWPLEYHIREVTDAESRNSHKDTVFLVEGSQVGYGPRV